MDMMLLAAYLEMFHGSILLNCQLHDELHEVYFTKMMKVAVGMDWVTPGLPKM